MLPRQTESVDPSAVPPVAAHGLAEGHVIASRYEIVRPLGSGGFANVYEALDLTLRKHVAIKLLRDDRISPGALRRFRREVALAQQVTSPHVVRVFDLGEADGRTFLTMELVEGETLRERLERGPLAITEALDIAESVLHALEELHALGIVHRDVKPSNVLIDSKGHVKLADLGLARDLASTETRATQNEGLLGTWEYISPEQALGKDSDERSDLYSFAVMLYECLTGALPFGERGSLGSILAHVKETPRTVRKLRPEVPRWLAAIVGRLLEKSPSRRIRSATEVLRALEKERAPLDVTRLLRWGAAVALAIAAAGLFWYVRQSRFDHLAAEGTGIAARDSLNRKLWSRSDVLPQSATVLSLPGGRKGVAAFRGEAGYAPRTGREELLILDALTGEVLERHEVPGFAHLFPDFADDFARTDLISTDIDHDGINELLVTYIHVYYPSLTLMYDAAINRVRFLLAASGHHHYAASVDVTGDGRDELLLVGTNNRLGWQTAVAAVDVIPMPQSTILNFGAARTPDAGSRNSSGRGPALAWYALLPPGYPQTRVNAGSREIVARYPDGRSLRLDFDGFIVGTRSKARGPAREELRRQAYTTLQRAELAAGGGDVVRYAAEARQAVAEAEGAGDPHLLQWASRVHGRSLIAAGRHAEAEEVFARIAAAPEMESDASFDAARQYHLAGQLEDSVRWYRRGYLSGYDRSVGRMRYEILEGAVLALSELGRLDRAEEVIDEYERVSAGEDLGHLRDFVEWRRGRPRRVERTVRGAPTDVFRYWALEYAQALGEAPALLLPRVLAEEKRNGTVVGLVQALKAKLLADLGRLDEAGAAIEAAARWHERMRSTDVMARAHAEILRERQRSIDGRSRQAGTAAGSGQGD